MNVVFYENENGNKPAKDFIDGQNKELQNVIKNVVAKVVVLKKEGLHIKEKLLKYLFDDIFEVRDVRTGLRIFVLFNEEQYPKEMVVFHIIIKKQDKIPTRELEVLKKRVKDYKR